MIVCSIIKYVEVLIKIVCELRLLTFKRFQLSIYNHLALRNYTLCPKTRWTTHHKPSRLYHNYHQRLLVSDQSKIQWSNARHLGYQAQLWAFKSNSKINWMTSFLSNAKFIDKSWKHKNSALKVYKIIPNSWNSARLVLAWVHHLTILDLWVK